jgi:hypothetical protein
LNNRKIKSILIGTAVAGSSCELEKYDKYSAQITPNTTLSEGETAPLSTSTLSETGVTSGENCDLTITPQLASGSTWIDCTHVTASATPFGAGTTSVTAVVSGCPAAVTLPTVGHFNVEYGNCDKGTSSFTKPTSEFTFK